MADDFDTAADSYPPKVFLRGEDGYAYHYRCNRCGSYLTRVVQSSDESPPPAVNYCRSCEPPRSRPTARAFQAFGLEPQDDPAVRAYYFSTPGNDCLRYAAASLDELAAALPMGPELFIVRDPVECAWRLYALTLSITVHKKLTGGGIIAIKPPTPNDL